MGFSRLSSLRSLSGEVQGLRVAGFTGSGLRVWDVGVVWRSSNGNFLDGSKMCFGDFVVFRDRMFGLAASVLVGAQGLGLGSVFRVVVELLQLCHYT